MGILTGFDAAAVAPAAILGLLGVWLGLRRSSVAWPMRWLLPFLGSCFVALPAALYLATHGEAADLLWFSGTLAATAAGAASFLVTLALLGMFMRNLRERVAVWTGSRRIGSAERIAGAAFGVACGFLVVAIPCGLYAALRPDPANDPVWARQSISLAYARGTSAVIKSALTEYLPQPPRMPWR